MSCANPPPAVGNPPLACVQVCERLSCANTPVIRCADEILHKFKTTVVEITVTPRFNLIPTSGSLSADVPPVFTETEQMRRIPMRMNGFFIDKGLILGSSAWLNYMYQAVISFRNAVACLGEGVVVGEPTLEYLVNLTNEQIWQIFNPTECVGGIPISSDISSLFEFTAEVKDVNGCTDKNFFYSIVPKGLTQFGLGLYEIRSRHSVDSPNHCVPCLEKVASLKFGPSVKYRSGNTAYVLGSWYGVNGTSISEGAVTNNSVIDRKGLITYQGIATSIKAGLGIAGAPILNQCAQVIGVATGLSSEGTVFGVTSDFIKPIVAALIHANEKRGKSQTCAIYSNVFGAYLYEHGTMNVKGEYVNAATLNLRSTAPADTPGAPLNCPPNDCHTLRRPAGFLLTEVCGCAQRATTTVECPPGINTLSAIPVQGCRTQIIRLAPGDVILAIDDIPIGVNSGQYGIGQILVNRECGDKVVVRFARLADGYRKEYDICITLESSLAWHSDVSSFYVPPPAIGEVPDMFPNMAEYLFNMVPEVEKSEYITELAYKSLAIKNSFMPPFPPLAPAPYEFYASQMNPSYYKYLLGLARKHGGVQYHGAVHYDFNINGIEIPGTACASISEILPLFEAYECAIENGPIPVPEPEPGPGPEPDPEP